MVDSEGYFWIQSLVRFLSRSTHELPYFLENFKQQIGFYWKRRYGNKPVKKDREEYYQEFLRVFRKEAPPGAILQLEIYLNEQEEAQALPPK